MLHGINALRGTRLAASDGEIGDVRDFYFDDRNWALRYLVVDTDPWLPGRQVLISPHSIGSLGKGGTAPHLSLSRKQIEACPSTDLHKPVSRQYEEQYYRYFGWPYYWEGDALWGMSGFPLLEAPVKPPAGEPAARNAIQAERADHHLRSTQAVNGYHLRAGEVTSGHICDFILNSETWAISHLVIKTGHRFSGREVRIPTSTVIRICYEDSTVYVNMTAEAVEKSPSNQAVPKAAALTLPAQSLAL